MAMARRFALYGKRENQLLKKETIAKQWTIKTILHQNNELLKLDQDYDKIEQITIVNNKTEEKVNKLSNLSKESKKQNIKSDCANS